MKKTMIIMIFLLGIFLVACNSNLKGKDEGDLVQVDYEMVQQFVDGKKEGFFIAVYDEKKEVILNKLGEILNNKNVQINYYNTYQPNGANGEISEKQIYGIGHKFKKNNLLYIKNGEVVDYIPLNLSNPNLSSQIESFIDVYS